MRTPADLDAYLVHAHHWCGMPDISMPDGSVLSAALDLQEMYAVAKEQNVFLLEGMRVRLVQVGKTCCPHL